LSDFQRVGAEVSLSLLGQGKAYSEMRELLGESNGPLDVVFESISEAARIILD